MVHQKECYLPIIQAKIKINIYSMVMLDSFVIPQDTDTKQQKYNTLLPQIRDIVYNEEDLIANLANVAAILHHGMGFSWTGFYHARHGELVLGPFQGAVAISRIAMGQGVCGEAYNKECTLIVDDVEQFAGHVPVTDKDKAEIVVPAYHKGEIALLLNINSNRLQNFTEVDKRNLEQIMHLLEEVL